MVRSNEGTRPVNVSKNAEMDKLREQRLCFHCREKWQYGQKCKPRATVAIIEECEGENENQDQGVEEENVPQCCGWGRRVKYH